MNRIRSIFLAFLALFTSADIGLAQWHAPSPYELDNRPRAPPETDLAAYCITYVAGVTELIALENTFKGPSPGALHSNALLYGSSRVSELYSELEPSERLKLDEAIVAFSKQRNFRAPLLGDATDYDLCLAGTRILLDQRHQ